MASVASALRNAPIRMIDTRPLPGASAPTGMRTHFNAARRTPNSMKSAKARAMAAVATAEDSDWALATPTTRASKVQAVTSSTAALAKAVTPREVPSRLRSSRMRANTGNAVMLIATPMNSEKVRKRMPSGAYSP